MKNQPVQLKTQMTAQVLCLGSTIALWFSAEVLEADFPFKSQYLIKLTITA